MKQAEEVVCAGIIVADHIAAPVDTMPVAGQLVLTDECFLTIGGCASNVAVDLSKMGVRASVCGCVGDDVFGVFAKQTLENHGIDVRHVITTREAATSQTLIVNVKGQDRRFIHLPGASRVFSTKHLPLAQILQAKIFYVGGYFLMDCLTPADLAAVFREARAADTITMVDVVTPGPDDYKSALATLLPETDFFLPNTDEARLMCGESDPVAQARAFRALGARNVVITCGEKGAVLFGERENLHAHAFPATFVDGTGGGDAFDAGFICGLLENGSPRRCLELGSALGASCVGKSGATAGVFTRAQADEFLRTHQLITEVIG